MRDRVMELRIHLGRVIRERRELRALTVPQLAHRAKLSANLVHSLEEGGRNPTLSEITAIAKVLDCTCELALVPSELVTR